MLMCQIFDCHVVLSCVGKVHVRACLRQHIARDDVSRQSSTRCEAVIIAQTANFQSIMSHSTHGDILCAKR